MKLSQHKNNDYFPDGGGKPDSPKQAIHSIEIRPATDETMAIRDLWDAIVSGKEICI